MLNHIGFKKLSVFAAVLLGLSSGLVLPAKAADEAMLIQQAKIDDNNKKADKKADDKLLTSKNQNHYIKIPALILPVIGDSGVEQIVSIVVVLEANSDDDVAAINELVPRINDAFMTQLYGSLDRREHMKNGVLDVNYIKQKLTDTANKIAGPDKIKNVLIQGISQHQP
jgi:flagellar basal body-associated protein FliL